MVYEFSRCQEMSMAVGKLALMAPTRLLEFESDNCQCRPHRDPRGRWRPTTHELRLPEELAHGKCRHDRAGCRHCLSSCIQ